MQTCASRAGRQKKKNDDVEEVSVFSDDDVASWGERLQRERAARAWPLHVTACVVCGLQTELAAHTSPRIDLHVLTQGVRQFNPHPPMFKNHLDPTTRPEHMHLSTILNAKSTA